MEASVQRKRGLRKCMDCDSEVSLRALWCPHCGAPQAWIARQGIRIAIAMFIFCAGNSILFAVSTWASSLSAFLRCAHR
jgi:hypothetical protein